MDGGGGRGARAETDRQHEYAIMDGIISLAAAQNVDIQVVYEEGLRNSRDGPSFLARLIARALQTQTETSSAAFILSIAVQQNDEETFIERTFKSLSLYGIRNDQIRQLREQSLATGAASTPERPTKAKQGSPAHTGDGLLAEVDDNQPKTLVLSPDEVDVGHGTIPTVKFGTTRLTFDKRGLPNPYQELLESHTNDAVSNCVYQAQYINRCLEGDLFTPDQMDRAAGRPRPYMSVKYANTGADVQSLPFTGCFIFLADDYVDVKLNGQKNVEIRVQITDDVIKIDIRSIYYHRERATDDRATVKHVLAFVILVGLILQSNRKGRELHIELDDAAHFKVPSGLVGDIQNYDELNNLVENEKAWIPNTEFKVSWSLFTYAKKLLSKPDTEWFGGYFYYNQWKSVADILGIAESTHYEVGTQEWNFVENRIELLKRFVQKIPPDQKSELFTVPLNSATKRIDPSTTLTPQQKLLYQICGLERIPDGGNENITCAAAGGTIEWTFSEEQLGKITLSNVAENAIQILDQSATGEGGAASSVAAAVPVGGGAASSVAAAVPAGGGAAAARSRRSIVKVTSAPGATVRDRLAEADRRRRYMQSSASASSSASGTGVGTPPPPGVAVRPDVAAQFQAQSRAVRARRRSSSTDSRSGGRRSRGSRSRGPRVPSTRAPGLSSQFEFALRF